MRLDLTRLTSVQHGKGYRTMLRHRLVAELALGRPLPEGSPVHHVNENKSDDRNENLVICENQEYHWLLHYRQRILDVGGNPNTDAICVECGPRPKEDFTPLKPQPTNPRGGRPRRHPVVPVNHICRSCKNKRARRSTIYVEVTHCRRGHEYNVEGRYGTACAACAKDRANARRIRLEKLSLNPN